MCLYYDCHSCIQKNIIYCESADIYTTLDPGCRVPTIDPEPLVRHKRCPTCKLIQGVTLELQVLVFQNPWLESEGLAGVETREDWELGPGLIKKEPKSIWSRGRVDEEWQIVANLERMGLGGLAGREALNEGEGFDETVFGDGKGKQEPAVTPWESSDSDGETVWEECVEYMVETDTMIVLVDGEVLTEVGSQFD